MKSSESPQSRRGKAPASEKQKQTARETIAQTQSWKCSTGAKTKLGRAIAAQNAFKPTFSRKLRSSDSEFEFKQALIFLAFEQLGEIAQRHRLSVENGRFWVQVKSRIRTIRVDGEEWHLVSLRCRCEIETVQWQGESIARSLKQLQKAQAAAQAEIREVFEQLQQVEDSPALPPIFNTRPAIIQVQKKRSIAQTVAQPVAEK